MKWLMIVVLLLRTLNSVACDYESNEEIVFQGSIDSVRIETRTVFPYVEDTRKCRIRLSVRIDKEWYQSSGEYIFGPDMTETDACSNAENRAKLNVMREVIPETLQSQRKLNCNTKDLTQSKSSCMIAYMDVVIRGQGKQKLKMEMCD